MKFCCCLSFLFLFFINVLNASVLNLDSLEEEILKNNREGKHKLSQKKLSELLLTGGLTKEEEGNVLFFLANTYRSVNDYTTCIDYLEKATLVAKTLPKENNLKMRIDYEYAFVYFDNNQFDKSRQVMDYIVAQNYKNAFPEDWAYLLMQQGYLLMKDKDYDEASNKYSQSYAIMEKANFCNLPIVMVKMMELQGARNNIRKVEELYKESMVIAEKCGILKYKTYIVAELENIYKKNNLLDKAYAVGLKVDSLRKLENVESKVSEMHLLDKALLQEKQKEKEETYFWRKVVFFSVLLIVIVVAISFYFRKKSKFENEKQKIEEELEQMKLELNSYIKNSSEKAVDFGGEVVFQNSDKLTERQNDLLKLLADGLSNKEIAEKLFITESTVKYHIRNIYSILELKDRKDLFKKMRNI